MDEGDAAPRDTEPALKLTPFAEDVLLHVVLHELGHALVREFDLPVLANEETLADAFATHYLTAHLRERAFAVLKARVQSLMFEARELPRDKWPVRGEHNSDARRAYQIVALALAADRSRYAPLADLVGMSDQDVRRSCDYGSEIHRSWRRTLRSLLMPAGEESREARFRIAGEGGTLRQLRDSKLERELSTLVKRFDWHSQVTILFAEGDGAAAWSRSKRTVTVREEYVRRFITQGRSIRGARKQ